MSPTARPAVSPHHLVTGQRRPAQGPRHPPRPPPLSSRRPTERADPWPRIRTTGFLILVLDWILELKIGLGLTGQEPGAGEAVRVPDGQGIGRWDPPRAIPSPAILLLMTYSAV